MKRYLLLALFLILSMFCHAQSSRNYKRNSTVKPLTAIDRKNYVITIDQSKLSKTKYSRPIDNYYRKTVLFVPVTLTNNSNDTVKYRSMSCSWEDFYIVDKKSVAEIERQPCDHNIPSILILPPHRSTTVRLPILKGRVSGKFRIGMVLIKLVDDKNLFDFSGIDDKFLLKNRGTNIIWSNPIELP
jgi:hypothetical protein